MITLMREKRIRFILIPSALALALLTTWYLSALSNTPNMAPSSPSTTASYSILPNIFLQSLPATSPSSFNPLNSSFGLIPRTYPTDPPSSGPPGQQSQWSRLGSYLRSLNSASTPQTKIKLLYLARHGEGFHNVAESYYGTSEWNRYWSRLDGNGTVVWADARLTETGEGQAQELGDAIEVEREGKGMLGPEAWVVSPLWRCLSTAEVTWGRRGWGGEGKVVVRERAREVIGVHTCDRRSTRREIQAGFRGYRLEEGLAEEDEWWDPEHRETVEERRARARELLDQIFFGDDDRAVQVVVSVTAHSGIIRAILEVVGHREWPLETGGMMPVVVKAVQHPK